MEPPLHIAHRKAGDVAVLELSGRLIFAGGEESLLRREVSAQVAGGTRKVLVDLSDVSYIDSGGVGSLITAYLHTVRRGGQLKVVCPNDRVCRVLRITHLTSVLDVFGKTEEAVASFATTGLADTAGS